MMTISRTGKLALDTSSQSDFTHGVVNQMPLLLVQLDVCIQSLSVEFGRSCVNTDLILQSLSSVKIELRLMPSSSKKKNLN